MILRPVNRLTGLDEGHHVAWPAPGTVTPVQIGGD